MSLIAEFTVQLPVLKHASECAPEMEVRAEEIMKEADGPLKFVFSAHGDQFDQFESGLDEDPTVDSYLCISRMDGSAYYRVTYVDADKTKGTYLIATEQDVIYLDSRLRDGEYYIRAYAPDRSSLNAIREHCDENDIPFRLEKLYSEESSVDREYSITDSQREALLTAYEEGYFESPRAVDLEGLATELGISRQAVADRLRRGYKELLETTIV